MSIRHAYRLFAEIDWPTVAAVLRSRRTRGWCERCRRPHGQTVYHLDDGRWWDTSVCAWRDGDGRVLRVWPSVEDLGTIAMTRVMLAKAHRVHDTRADLLTFCQRCRGL